MRGAFGLVGLLIVLGVGYYIYTVQLKSGVDGESLPQQVNLTAIRSDLLSLGQAERLYFAANGRYADIEELRSSEVVNTLPGSGRQGYTYSFEADGADRFRITAKPPDDSGADLPTLFIDETMQMSQKGAE